MTPRVSTLMKCVVSTAVVPPEVRSTGEEPPPPPTAETGARCFWTQDTHFATGAEQGTLPESQVFLNCSSSWVSQLLGICKRTKCKYSPLPFFFQSNYVVWPYWALMPKRICTRPQNSEFHMKLMGQVETYREVKDNRLWKTMPFLSQLRQELTWTAVEGLSADPALEHSKAQTLKQGGELRV